MGYFEIKIWKYQQRSEIWEKEVEVYEKPLHDAAEAFNRLGLVAARVDGKMVIRPVSLAQLSQLDLGKR